MRCWPLRRKSRNSSDLVYQSFLPASGAVRHPAWFLKDSGNSGVGQVLSQRLQAGIVGIAGHTGTGECSGRDQRRRISRTLHLALCYVQSHHINCQGYHREQSHYCNGDEHYGLSMLSQGTTLALFFMNNFLLGAIRVLIVRLRLNTLQCSEMAARRDRHRIEAGQGYPSVN
jgi:hypothetical protein